jgi:acyl-coenzyme A synthetase/AMP-(fatty) acid ligase
MTLENCVLSHVQTSVIPSSESEAIDTHITLSRDTLNDLILGKTTVEDAIASDDIQLPSVIRFVEQLPQTSTGKVDRRKLLASLDTMGEGAI